MKNRNWNTRSMEIQRAGFTLVELLMVISIMAVLGGLALSMIGGARHDANAARTETQIRRIRQFIEARLEDYQVRILPYRLDQYSMGGVPLTRDQIRALRNRILIEYIRAEMPCRLDASSVNQVSDPILPTNRFPSAHFIADFGTVDRPNTPPIPPPILLVDEMKNNPPAQITRMARNLKSAVPTPASPANEQAECLFEILNSHNDYASSGMDFVFRSEVRDTDGDNHPEILDAWGDPLQFTIHMLNQEADTLDNFNASMNTDGPVSVHIDVTSVNLPK